MLYALWSWLIYLQLGKLTELSFHCMFLFKFLFTADKNWINYHKKSENFPPKICPLCNSHFFLLLPFPIHSPRAQVLKSLHLNHHYPCLAYTCTLKMERVHSSKMLVPTTKLHSITSQNTIFQLFNCCLLDVLRTNSVFMCCKYITF
jgi:hypothetical protein